MCINPSSNLYFFGDVDHIPKDTELGKGGVIEIVDESDGNEIRSNSSSSSSTGTEGVPILHNRSERSILFLTSKLPMFCPETVAKIKYWWAFFNFNEPNPVHRVWYNPSNLELAIVWSAIILITLTSVGIAMFALPIPYVTWVGNVIIVAAVSMTTTMELLHFACDRPAKDD